MLRELWQLAKSIQEQDPARPSLLEVFLCYPGYRRCFHTAWPTSYINMVGGYGLDYFRAEP